MSIQSYRIRKLVKSSNRQFDKIYHHTILKNKPKILVNSIQKAGTHVLTNALHNALPQRFKSSYFHLYPDQESREPLQDSWTLERARLNDGDSLVLVRGACTRVLSVM